MILQALSCTEGTTRLAPFTILDGEPDPDVPGAAATDKVPAAAMTLVRKHRPQCEFDGSPTRSLVLFLSGETTVTDGGGHSVKFGPGDVLYRDAMISGAYTERYRGEVYQIILHCPDFVPDSVGAQSAVRCDDALDKVGPPVMCRLGNDGDGDDADSVLTAFTWPGPLVHDEPDLAEWIPVDVARFVTHQAITVDPEIDTMAEPKPTTIGWHRTGSRCLFVMLSGSARTYPSRGRSVLRERGDVLLAEDTTGKGHFNMFQGDGIGLVIYLADGALADPQPRR